VQARKATNDSGATVPVPGPCKVVASWPRHSDLVSSVDEFLRAIEGAAIGACAAWTADCVLDATVPNWRFQKTGPEAIRAVYGQWFAYPNTLVGLRRWAVQDTEIVEYVHRFTGPDGVREAHHLHVLELRDGQISKDTMFCGGQWSSAQLAEMANADT
jgi:hypothetical protein